MSELLSYIGDFINYLRNGVIGFVDFIMRLPSLFHDLIEILPQPLYLVVISFIGFLIFVIILKVVRLIVG